MNGGRTQRVNTRRWGLFALLLFAVIGTFGSLATSSADAAAANGAPTQTEGAAQTISGFVNNEYLDDGERIREGVPGVRIVVETESGELVAESVTDENGRYVIPVDEPGTYVIRLDTSTLPDDLTLPDDQAVATRELTARNSATQIFKLGEDLRQVAGKWSQLPQTIGNGLKLSFIIAITSIGLSLVFGTTGLSNFAHGETVTFGALVALTLNKGAANLPLAVAAGLSMIITALASAGLELGVWRQLRRRGTSLTSMMIVSIGIALAARNLYLFLVGGDLKNYREYLLQEQVHVLGIDFAPRTLWIMLISLIALLGTAYFLLRTRFGKAIRAVSDNPDLASSSGINSDHVILVVFVLGGLLASMGGVFYGLEYSVRSDMGFAVLLLMFAAITLGGLGNPFGAMLGSLIVGMMVELWTFVVPNANDLKNVGALVVLIALLLVRPQGLLGNKERIG